MTQPRNVCSRVARHLWSLVSYHTGPRKVSQEEAVRAYLYPARRVKAEPKSKEQR